MSLNLFAPKAYKKQPNPKKHNAENEENRSIAYPTHIGIIMDGNGRWATKKKIPRTQGHIAGVTAAKNAIRTAIEKEIPFLTLYVFSTENWIRPKKEVLFILKLLAGNLRKHYTFYKENNIKIVCCGNVDEFSPAIKKEIQKVTEETQHNSGVVVNLALNYGGRNEIVRAIQKAHRDYPNENITEELLSRCMDHPNMPHPDLIIRTGGQTRISNFLLWESAYAELYFSPVLWPDWSSDDFTAAITYFSQQERRFGGV